MSRVREKTMELRLEHLACSSTEEGSNCGVSSGERRRVCIGVDLVHYPAVILIDEPTSGLDSASAFHVVTQLKSMVVNQGKTIVLTSHQPSFRILELFDGIVLLSNVFDVFMMDRVRDLLEERLKLPGHRIPPHVNVLEFDIDAIQTLVLQKS
ncbi:hypothetical protein SLA2020_129300 [Shorea laevis]